MQEEVIGIETRPCGGACAACIMIGYEGNVACVEC